MRVAIIGTGGIGGYFGGKISKAGYDVTFIARGEHLKAIQAKGLIVKSILGNFQINTVNATNRIQDIGKADLIILGVKAWQIRDISNQLKPIIHKNTTILPLQNGISVTDELIEQIDKKYIIGGLCRIISKIESPGIINHFGVTPTIVFGELDSLKISRTQKIKELFDKSGIKSKISDDINSELWKKFVSVCVSGLLAVTKTTYGELRGNSATRQMMINLLTEGYLLSQKSGIQIEHVFLERTVSFIDTLPYKTTSSLSRDIWEGKPSEIEYQNGTIVKLGEKYGIDTPVNRFIYNCILPMEIKARNK